MHWNEIVHAKCRLQDKPEKEDIRTWILQSLKLLILQQWRELLLYLVCLAAHFDLHLDRMELS